MNNPIILTFIIVLFLNFFGITNISNTILLLLLLPFVFISIKQRNLVFKKTIIVMLIGMVLNIFSADIFNGQKPITTFKGMSFFYYIFLYFLLWKYKPDIKQTHNTILYLCIIFDVLYILQFIMLQQGIVFLPVDENSIDQGEGARFRMIGSGLASLSVFLGINDYLTKRKIHYLILCAIGFIVLFLMAFRTMVFLCLIFSLIEIILVEGMKRRTLVYIICFFAMGFILLQIPIISDKLDYMWEKQFEAGSNDNFSNKEYIRWITLDYYYSSHFQNIFEMILGSGYPQSESVYYANIEKQLWSIGIYWMDWGLLGLSWMLGILPVGAMITYSIKAARLKVDNKNYFIGIWFVYLILSSITTAEFFRQGNFIIQALCLYYIELVYKKNIKNV